jgi:hypothetical protein
MCTGMADEARGLSGLRSPQTSEKKEGMTSTGSANFLTGPMGGWCLEENLGESEFDK